jgi:hypothetical protein
MVKNRQFILYFLGKRCYFYSNIFAIGGRLVNIPLAKGTAHEKRSLHRNAKHAIRR